MSAATPMTGFPPAPEDQVTLANWRTAPFSRWAFQHVREIIPSADIPNDPEHVWALPSRPGALAELSIWHEDGPIGFDAFLDATDTDGIVVLHRGAIVAESYRNGMNAHQPHIWMSVSKSLLGAVAGILIERGVLDPDRPVDRILPEVGGTAYAGATVRHLLDMRAGIQFDEDYLAVSGPIVEYRKAQNWNPLEPGDKPSDLRGFYRHLTTADGAHAGRFHYVSPNTDLLGWAIERAAGRRYADLVSELLWRPLGATRSAYITVDRLGAPRCAGGVCAAVADLARLGQLIVQNGRRDGLRIIPEVWIEDVLGGGDAEAWNRGDFVDLFGGRAMHYRSKWYVLREAEPVVFGFGVYGQNLFVDPANEIVVAKASSQAMPLDESRIGLTMQGLEAMRRHLAG